MYGRCPWADLKVSPRRIAWLLDRLTYQVATVVDRDRARTQTLDATVCVPPFSDPDRAGTAPSGDSTGPDRTRTRPDGPPRGADRTQLARPPGPKIGPVPVGMEVRTACRQRRSRRTMRPLPVTDKIGQRGRRRCGACSGGDATRLR